MLPHSPSLSLSLSLCLCLSRSRVVVSRCDYRPLIIVVNQCSSGRDRRSLVQGAAVSDERRLRALLVLRDLLPGLAPAAAQEALSIVLPALLAFLLERPSAVEYASITHVRPSFLAPLASMLTEAVVQRQRHAALAIINRLSFRETHRQEALQTTDALLRIFEQENEENALVILRTLIELHKSCRGVLEAEVSMLR
jgi:hypothetical protein